jgi:hypothetical protein
LYIVERRLARIVIALQSVLEIFLVRGDLIDYEPNRAFLAPLPHGAQTRRLVLW